MTWFYPTNALTSIPDIKKDFANRISERAASRHGCAEVIALSGFEAMRKAAASLLLPLKGYAVKIVMSNIKAEAAISTRDLNQILPRRNFHALHEVISNMYGSFQSICTSCCMVLTRRLMCVNTDFQS